MKPRARATLLGSLGWFAVSYGAAVAGYLALNALASRWLGLESYGSFVVVLTVSSVVGQLGLLGAHRGGLREAARMTTADPAVLDTLRRSARAVCWASLPLAAALLAAGVLLLRGTDPEMYALAAGLALTAFLGGLLKLWANYLRGFGRVRLASLLEGRSGGALVGWLQAAMLAVVWWCWPGTGLAGATLALAVGYLLPVLGAGWLVRREWAGISSAHSLWADLVDMAARNWRFAVNQAAVYMSGTVEIWIAGVVLVSSDASQFSAAQRLALLLAVAPTALQVVFAPVTARMLDTGEQDRLEAVLRTGATLSALLTCVLLVPMLAAPVLVLEWAYGEAFREAAIPLMLLSIAGLGNAASGLCGTALTMSHREGMVAAVQGVSVLLRVLLGTAAALVFGLQGLAVVAAVLTLATYAVLWWQARRLLGLRTEPTLRPRLRVLRQVAG